MARRRRGKLPDEEDLQYLQELHRQRRHKIADPPRVNNIIASLMALRGYGQIESLSALDEAWRAAVGEGLASQTRLGKLSRGVLPVYVANSALIQELTFRKQELVAELVRRLPDHKLRELRFRMDAAG
jgi:predicted nucleic acid-binding Zn ribbon protein